MDNTWFLKNELSGHIEAITDQKPQWGKMSAQHMVEHLNIIFNISNGSQKVKLHTTDELMEKMKRHVFIYKNPFPKNLRAPVLPEEPIPLINESIPVAKEQLSVAIDLFYKNFEGQPEKTEMHPVLGELTFDEWVFFHTKHCSHHLTQFGLMDGEITP